MIGFASGSLAAALVVGLALCSDFPYLFRAEGLDPSVLVSDEEVGVRLTEDGLAFVPAGEPRSTALLFFPGGRVEPAAYAPLARACTARGYRTFLADPKSTALFAAARKAVAIETGEAIRRANPDVTRWVVAGHSFGAATAAEVVHRDPAVFAGMALIATTHPRDFDLSSYSGEVLKVVGTADRVAPLDKVEANRHLLPESTHWVRIEGGNHSQFGFYGAQAGDGKATISREAQLAATLEAILDLLERVERRPLEADE